MENIQKNLEHLRFEFQPERQILIPYNKAHQGTPKSSGVPYSLSRNFYSIPVLQTMLGMSLQEFNATDIRFSAAIHSAKKFFPKEIMLWMLEYTILWDQIKDKVYQKSEGRYHKLSGDDFKKELKKLGIKAGSKSVNISGKLVRIQIVLSDSTQDIKKILSKKNPVLGISNVIYNYKTLKYSCSFFGQQDQSSFIVSYPNKQLLLPDKTTVQKVKKFIAVDGRPMSVSPKLSITKDNLYNLFQLNNLVSKEIRVKMVSKHGVEIRFLSVDQILKEKTSDALVMKILEVHRQHKTQFTRHDSIYAFDPDDIRRNKKRIIDYLVKAELQDFLNLVNNLRPSFTTNKKLIESLDKKGFQAVLQDHQKVGVTWLNELHEKKAPGAILADEMGLGKTVQTIGFLTAANAVNKKTLIVCPASVISVWESELLKFNPVLYKKIGSGIEILSYEKAQRSAPSKVDFLILDEAQKVKNSSSLSFKALATIKKEFTVIVSGTPIENSIKDLFSLLQLLDESTYDLMNIMLKAYPDDNELAKIVRGIIDPIYLQRKKSKEQLSASLDIIPVKVKSTPFDQKLQSKIQQIFRDDLIRMHADNNHDYYSMVFITGLLRLRQAVSNPALLPQELQKHFTSQEVTKINNVLPTKARKTSELYQEIKARGEKVVIFARFPDTIAMLKKELSSKGAKCLTLTGTDPAPKRKTMITEFQKPSSGFDVFIISMQAGATGITLTNANNVIVYDLWYNPAVVAQAIARVHRIGQNKDVKAYLLIQQDTIDADIDKIFMGKQQIISSFDKKDTKVPKSAVADLGKKIFG